MTPSDPRTRSTTSWVEAAAIVADGLDGCIAASTSGVTPGDV